ncbi:MAG: cellulase family glycosylhydrolase [Paludibacteraceae bacterium]|nr:cellulase family glycosylhydrolase [Prevotellaceae bacterium]
MEKKHLLLKWTLCALMAFSVVNANAADYPTGSPVSKNGKPKVVGTQMVSECGEPIQLRGMSSHGLAWYPKCYTENAIKALTEDWGIDIFRLAVYTHEWGGYTTEQWKTKEEYNQYIDELVDLCAKYGIYCLIDWHVLNQGSGNPNYTLDDAKEFWDYMSKKHKGAKHVIYEICNEPNGSSVTWDKVKQYADAIIPIIRKNDPNTIVVCGSPTWSQDVDVAAENPLSYTNVMYSLHFYSGTHTSMLRKKAQTAIDKGLALFVTEFGTSRADGNGGVYLEECNVWMDWMKERKISWCNWSYAGKDETSAALLKNSCDTESWNDVSDSGGYIKGKLLEPDVFDENCINSVEQVSYNDKVFVFPNPVKDEVSLDLPEGSVMNGLQIVDMMGRCVYAFNGSVDRVDVSELNQGSYFVKIVFTNGFAVKHIVKE